MNSYTNSSNFDTLFLQTLMDRLQIRPQTPLQPLLSPLFNQTLEDLLLDTINNISDTESDQDDDEKPHKTQLAKEESKLEKEVIKIILSGNAEESLKPNSGQAVSIGEHHICVGYHVESGTEYRVWEWHGHIMLFDDENGYNPEYIYGNYFERLRGVIGKKMNDVVGKGDDDKEEKIVNSGLKELIGSSEESGSGRILHRNMNAGSSRYTDGLKDVDPEQAEEMFDAASRYLLFPLKRAVADAVLPHLEMIPPAELCHWLILSDLYGVLKIREYCLDIIACNFETFADTREFRAMLLTVPPPSGDSSLRTTVPNAPGAEMKMTEGNVLDDLREKWLEVEAGELDKRDESALLFDKRLEMLMMVAEQEQSVE